MSYSLFCCSTPYQVMLAAMISLQENIRDVSDIIITDTFGNSEKIYQKVTDSGFFNSVFYCRVKDIIVTKNINSKVKKALNYINYRDRVKEVVENKITYDSFYFNCEDIFAFNMITILKMQNPKCVICRYEEGYSSYTNTETNSRKSRDLIVFRNKFIKNNPSLKIDRFYVFEPSLLLREYDCQIVKINRNLSQNTNFQNFIDYVFDAKNIADTYKKKIVIFEESFYVDGYDVGDVELYTSIIDKVGKGQVIIKMHPRSVDNRFEHLGVEVKKPDGIPWEAIVLSSEMNDSIFISLGSGSVINSKMLAGSGSKGILLFKCMKDKPKAFGENYYKFVDGFNRKYPDGLLVPDSRDELFSYL